MFITPLWNEKWSRVEAILLHFYFYSIFGEKIEFYIGDTLSMDFNFLDTKLNTSLLYRKIHFMNCVQKLGLAYSSSKTIQVIFLRSWCFVFRNKQFHLNSSFSFKWFYIFNKKVKLMNMFYFFWWIWIV